MTPALHPYPAYKPSGIAWLGDVPEHWGLVQLGRIGRISKGTGGTKEDETPEGIPCIRYGDLYTSHKFHIVGSRTFVTEAKALEYTPIQYGDILFAGSGETIEEIGKSAVNLMESPACCGGDVILFRPDIDVDARFSGYAIDCPQSQYQKSCMGRGITIMHIYGDELKRLWVTLPPLPEQTAIARYLDYVDRRVRRYVEAKRKLIALLEEERQAVIHQAVTRGLDPNVPLKPSGVEWLGDIPAHWDVRRLRIVGEALIGLTYSPRDIVDEENGVLVLRASNILEGRMVYRDSVFVQCAVPDRLVTRVGDILICSRSGSRSLIGKNAKIDAKSSGKTFGVFMTIFRSKHSSYLYYVFNSRLFDYLSGAFLTSTINQLTLGVLNSIEIPFPPTREQEALVMHLDDATANIDTAIARARRQIELVEEYRTRLIADVVTGKLDVRAAAARLPLEEDNRVQEALDSSPAGAGGALVPANALE